jgi:hypothetical protein
MFESHACDSLLGITRDTCPSIELLGHALLEAQLSFRDLRSGIRRLSEPAEARSRRYVKLRS